MMNITRFSTAALLATVWAVCPAAAQSLTGTVTAADTGTAMVGATVLAVKKPTLLSQPPTIYQSVVDSGGHFDCGIARSVCAVRPRHAASLYFDPCQWGNPVTATVGASAAAAVPLTLQKGVRFIVRVHDTKQLLSQAETVQGAGISASLTAPSVKLFPLPVVYSDGIVRDYGTVVPISVPMSVTISSNLLLADKTGTPVSASAMPFQVLPTDIEVTGAPLSPATRMFPPPDARMVHVYATGLASLAK